MILASLTAFWLGILTAISPCPMATNIAAISFISKNIETPSKTIVSGVLYTIGRILTYVILGFILVGGLLALPSVANFLQYYINKLVGPLLLLIGLFLIGVFKQKKCSCNCEDKTESIEKQYHDKVLKYGGIGSLLLGSFFALSFCPTSAALFFGSLSTLSVEYDSRLILPLIYGLGTGLPVVIFAIFIAFSVHKIAELHHNILKFECWFRKVTGIIFIAAGFYFLYAHIITN